MKKIPILCDECEKQESSIVSHEIFGKTRKLCSDCYKILLEKRIKDSK